MKTTILSLLFSLATLSALGQGTAIRSSSGRGTNTTLVNPTNSNLRVTGNVLVDGTSTFSNNVTVNGLFVVNNSSGFRATGLGTATAVGFVGTSGGNAFVGNAQSLTNIMDGSALTNVSGLSAGVTNQWKTDATNAASGQTIYASNLVSGGQIPIGTLLAGTTNGNAGGGLIETIGTQRWRTYNGNLLTNLDAASTNKTISGATLAGSWTNSGAVLTGGFAWTNYATGAWMTYTNGVLTIGPTNAAATITLNGTSGNVIASLFNGGTVTTNSATLTSGAIQLGNGGRGITNATPSIVFGLFSGNGSAPTAVAVDSGTVTNVTVSGTDSRFEVNYGIAKVITGNGANSGTTNLVTVTYSQVYPTIPKPQITPYNFGGLKLNFDYMGHFPSSMTTSNFVISGQCVVTTVPNSTTNCSFLVTLGL